MATPQMDRGRAAESEETRFKTDSRQPLGKVIELIGHSKESFDDAIRETVRSASETIDHVSGVEVRRMSCKVRDGDVVEYVVDLKLAFGVERQNH